MAYLQPRQGDELGVFPMRKKNIFCSSTIFGDEIPHCHWLNAFLLASNSSKPFVVHR
jgi:hypothetical protein